MKSDEFVRLNLIYLLYILGIFLGWNIIDLYFVKVWRFSFLEISMYYLLFSLSSLLSIISLNGLKIARAIKFSQTLRIWSIVLVIFFFSKVQLYIVGVLIGITVELFWIPYYSRYEEFSKQSRDMKGVAFLKNFSFLAKIAAPFIGGIIAAKLGYLALFVISISLFGVNILNAVKINRNDVVMFNWIDSLKDTRGTKTLVILEGIWQTIPFMVIPVYTTRFIQDEIRYGLFVSYLAVFTLIGFYTTKKTNLSQKIYLLYPLTFLTGALAIVSSFSYDLVGWIVMTGLLTLIWKFAEALTTTVVLEKTRDFAKSVVSRRFFIALGRLIGSLLTSIVLLTFGRQRLDIALMVLGAAFVFYPVLLYFKRHDIGVQQG